MIWVAFRAAAILCYRHGWELVVDGEETELTLLIIKDSYYVEPFPVPYSSCKPCQDADAENSPHLTILYPP